MAIPAGVTETVPSTIYPARLGLDPVEADQIRLQAGGGNGWMGTFHLALHFVIADMLQDNDGFDAVVQVEHHNDTIHLLRGKIVSVDPSDLTFEDGVQLNLGDVLSITF